MAATRVHMPTGIPLGIPPLGGRMERPFWLDRRSETQSATPESMPSRAPVGPEIPTHQPASSAYLGEHQVLVKTVWGGHVVVPAFNIDVALGVIRDRTIKPWTTRLVQELLRPGDVYLNAGANFGYFVALGGGIVGVDGRVYGVEPNPHIFPFLLKTVYWNGSPKQSRLYRRALSNTQGNTLSFQFDPQFLGNGKADHQHYAGGPAAPPATQFLTLPEAIWNAENIDHLLDSTGCVVDNQRLMVRFSAVTSTIDQILAAENKVALIHLDIEGAEPFALAGAMHTIRRSPGIRLITEWSAEEHFLQAPQRVKEMFIQFWNEMSGRGYFVRHVEPRLADNGSIFLSAPLSLEAMTEQAIHGDYLWVARENDPWG